MLGSEGLYWMLSTLMLCAAVLMECALLQAVLCCCCSACLMLLIRVLIKLAQHGLLDSGGSLPQVTGELTGSLLYVATDAL